MVPYQALPLLQFFMHNIHTGEVLRKGEGEPGNEAIYTYVCTLRLQLFALNLPAQQLEDSKQTVYIVTGHQWGFLGVAVVDQSVQV